MRHFLRLAVLVSMSAGMVPAQFHLPGLSSGGSSAPKTTPPSTTPPAASPPTAKPPDASSKPPAETTQPSGRVAGVVDYYALIVAWPSGKPVVTAFEPRANAGTSPESCAVKPASKAAMSIVGSLMLSQVAIQREWMKHGSCTGFTAAEYFNAMRYVRSLVQIPVQLTSPDEGAPKQTPQLIETQFASANAGYPAGAFMASASDVRICFNPQFRPQACPSADSAATGPK